MSRQGKRRTFLRGAAVLLGAVLAFGNFGNPVFGKMDCRAAEYYYTVTFYPGNHGSFQGTEAVTVDNSASGSSYEISASGSAIRISGLCAGDVVGLDAAMEGAVELEEDSRYYVKGIRVSGRDNATVDTSAFRVEEDRDYVVAYGIRGDLTSYVVNYQDGEGNTLAPSRTYYGNVGDRPRMAYLYIAGYQPQAYNLTKTLSKNTAENVFTFVYRRIPAAPAGSGGGAGTGAGGAAGGTGVQTPTGGGAPAPAGPGVTVPGQAGALPNPDADQGADNPDDQEDGTGQGGAVPNPDDGTGQGGAVPDPDEGNDEPLDEVDLDDEPAPLGGFDGEKENSGQFPIWGSVGIAVAGAAAVVAAVWVMLAARKREKTEQDDHEEK